MGKVIDFPGKDDIPQPLDDLVERIELAIQQAANEGYLVSNITVDWFMEDGSFQVGIQAHPIIPSG